MKQFDLWLADLNPRLGSEAGKIRPVVIIQTDLLNSTHPSTIICPITTKVSVDSEILRVHLYKPNIGLKEDSDIMIDHIRTLDNRRLIKKIGVVTTLDSYRIKENLKIVLDL
ncbi:MAG: type II toxin-antitoxin system PemK/MazF family toxin [Saprospiraceae bacterium]